MALRRLVDWDRHPRIAVRQIGLNYRALAISNTYLLATDSHSQGRSLMVGPLISANISYRLLDNFLIQQAHKLA